MSQIAPFPSLQRRPLDLGSALSGAFAIFKTRWQLFVAQAAAALGALVLTIALAYAPMIFGVVLQARSSSAAVGVLLGGAVFALVVYCVGMLTMAKLRATMLVTAVETRQGQQTSFGQAWGRLQGFSRRMFVLIMLLVGLWLVVGLVVGGVIVALMAAIGFSASGSSSSDPNPGAIVGVLFGVMFLYVAIIVVALWLAVKFLYVVPAMALEGLSGPAALKRSWSMTRGNFWRTLGWVIVIGLIMYGIQIPFTMVGQVVFIPGQIAMSKSLAVGDVPQTAEIVTLVGSLVLYLLISLSSLLVTMPLQQIFVGLMFDDQRDRDAMVAAGIDPKMAAQANRQTAAAWPQQPGYGAPQGSYAPPAQQWGQPAQPQQGWGDAAQQGWGQPQQPQQPSQPPSGPYGPYGPSNG